MGAGGVTNHGTYDIEARKLEPVYKPKVLFPHDHAWNWNNPMPRGKEHLEPDYENFKD